MKKIQPARAYDQDHGYPRAPGSDPDVLPQPERRRSLRLLGVGLAALGGSLVLSRNATAAPAQAPARPSDCPTTLTLNPRFRLSGNTYGRVVLESADTRLIATLGQDAESQKVRQLVTETLRKGWASQWHLDAQRVNRMERAIAKSMVSYYRRQLRRPLAKLAVQLVIIPPAAPRRRRRNNVRLSGVPPRPRFRGCASCATADDSADLMVPAAITAVGLYTLRRRRIAALEETSADTDTHYDA